MTYPVFDLHCDTALALLGDNLTDQNSLRNNALHVDLLRAGENGGYAQCFACFTTPMMRQWCSLEPEEVFSRELNCILFGFQENPDKIRQAFSVEQIEANLMNGIFSGILTIEGPAGFGYDPGKLEELFELGFRITTLGWNESNPLTGSHITGEGLTELGREYVKEAQRVGMLIDVSHVSDRAFWQIIDISTAPVIASHSNSRSVWNVSRNLTDEMFTAICQTGGVTGINLYSDFLGDNPDLNTVCDHILHFMELDQIGKHICLGGDLDGCDKLPYGFSGVQDYPKLAEALLLRGVSSDTVYDIFWNNAMGVMKHCCM